MSEGNEGKSDEGSAEVDGRLSMKERTSAVTASFGFKCTESLPPVEFVSVNSKVEGTVEGALSCSSRLEVTNEFHTSASNDPSK
jgi:hypothetical protein